MIHLQPIRHRGFTLIELMIVVAVIGLLAVVAYPSFQQSIIKSDRNDGRNALVEVQLAQERYRAANPLVTVYLDNIGLPAFPSSLEASGTEARISERGWYEVSVAEVPAGVSTATRGGYLLIAEAVAGSKQANDRTVACRRMAIEVSLGGTKRGHMSEPSGGTFVESSECW